MITFSTATLILKQLLFKRVIQLIFLFLVFCIHIFFQFNNDLKNSAGIVTWNWNQSLITTLDIHRYDFETE